MAASSKSRRVTTVPLTSAASGARIIDLIPLPLPVFIIFRLIVLAFKHWLTILIIALSAWAYFMGYAIPLVLSTLLLIPLSLYAYVALTNRHHSPQAHVRALFHLWQLHRRWASVCRAGRLDEGPRTPRIPWLRRPPRITDEFGYSLTLQIDTSTVNATPDSVEQRRNEMADNLRCKRIRVRRIKPGMAEMTFEWQRDHNGQITHGPALSLDESGLVHIELDTSLLVVGESGSGKSTLGWNFLNELNTQEIPYKLTAIDPKKVELTALQNSPHLVRYATEPQDIRKAIEDFRDQMNHTLHDMETKGIRKAPISKDYPLNILLVDELLLVGEEFKNDPSQSALGRVLILGRAANFIVIGNSQLSQGDALGRIRDLFPQRICMATKSGHITNAVLGPNAEERGARCSEITSAGTGYIYTDASGTFQRFQALEVPDPGVQRISLGLSYSPQSAPKAVWARPGGYVYTLWAAPQPEHLKTTDEPERPLYVGQAKNPNKRFQQHSQDKEWWNQVDHSRTEISRFYSTKEDLNEAEKERIQELKPRMNLVHRNYGS